jgi:hypothetical protein
VIVKVLPNDDYSRLARIGETGGDVPIALKDACKDVFNDAILVATLMAEHRRGNCASSTRIAGYRRANARKTNGCSCNVLIAQYRPNV